VEEKKIRMEKNFEKKALPYGENRDSVKKTPGDHETKKGR